MKNLYKGILYIIFAAFCFSLLSMFIRLAGDLPAVQKSFFRNFVATIFSFILLKKSKYKFKIEKGNLKYLLLRSIIGTLGIFFNFYAISHLYLADANMLNKLSPFFAVIFSYFFLKEKIKPIQIVALMIALVGSMFIIKPTFENAELLPSFIGLMGGICAGFAYTMVRKLGNRGQSGISIVFFFSAFSCVVSFLLTLFVYEPMTGKQISYLLLGGIAALGGQLGITNAYINAPAKQISIYDYSQILFAALIGFWVFKQLPDIYSFIGYTLIVLMAFLMFQYHKKKSDSKNMVEKKENME